MKVLLLCAFVFQFAHAFVPASLLPRAVSTVSRVNLINLNPQSPLSPLSPAAPFRKPQLGSPPGIRRKQTNMTAAAALAVGALPPITLKGILLLAATISLSLCGATSMKLSAGFKNLVPSVLMFVFYISSFSLFTVTLQYWPISIAYAIWSGVGTAAMGVIGSVWFGERLQQPQLIGILLVIMGTVFLNL